MMCNIDVSCHLCKFNLLDFKKCVLIWIIIICDNYITKHFLVISICFQHLTFDIEYCLCRNLNIGSVTKCEVQGSMRPKVSVGVKHTLTNEGKCKGWRPMTPKCTMWELHLCGSCECSEPWLERQTNTKLSPHDTITKALKCRFLKCHHIGHLVMKCMSYDQKKGRESN
jgi:hypothetical protein